MVIKAPAGPTPAQTQPMMQPSCFVYSEKEEEAILVLAAKQIKHLS